MESNSLMNDIEEISNILADERMELQVKVNQLTKLIAFLEDEESAELYTDVEVREQAKLAHMALESKDAQIELFIRKTQTPDVVALDVKHTCKCAHLMKPISLHSNPEPSFTIPWAT